MFPGSDDDFTYRRLILVPHRNYFVERLPSAADIFEGLKNILNKDAPQISDMLPHDYLYKPVCLDLTDIHSDEEYRALKSIKKARYIHRELIERAARPDRLLKDILDGEIVLRNEFMTPALAGISSAFVRKMHPEFENPLVFDITESAAFDVYFGASLSVMERVCETKRLSLGGYEFELSAAEPVPMNTAGEVCVLQTECRVKTAGRMENNNAGAFRVRLRANDGTLYYKEGSVPDSRSIEDMKENTAYYPFMIILGGRR